MKDFLTYVGFVTIVFLVAMVLYVVTECIKRIIRDKLNLEQNKSSLEMVRIAKCSCVDCEYYDKANKRCIGLDTDVSEKWFCGCATPRKEKIIIKLRKYRYRGYNTTVYYSDEDSVFHGKLEGIRDLVTFESKSLEDAETEFHKAVDDYIDYKQSF